VTQCEMPDLSPVDVGSAGDALQSAADRVAALVGSVPDATASIPGMTWTVEELGVHLTRGAENYVSFVSGGIGSPLDLNDIPGGSLTRSNAALIDSESERDLAALMTRYRRTVSELLSASRGRKNDETVQWHGVTVTLGALLGLAVGEALVHGYDLAKALRKPWRIAPDQARLVLSSSLPLLPYLLDKTATADVVASYELRVRGGEDLTLRFHLGTLTVEAPGGRVDCLVSADPVTLLLIAYGRVSHWVPALTGKMFAWGHKPWLGFRLTSYLVNPG
jgi:uncharacterized protein (TIGR03083 family)